MRVEEHWFGTLGWFVRLADYVAAEARAEAAGQRERGWYAAWRVNHGRIEADEVRDHLATLTRKHDARA